MSAVTPVARLRVPHRLAARSPWLRWPLPALAAWAGGWLLYVGAQALGLNPALAFVVALLLPCAMAWPQPNLARRLWMALGFPLSAAVLGQAGPIPAWLWLAPLAALLMLYPLRAWRDAPWWPTRTAALEGLAQAVPLPAGARVRDVGCGLGDGLMALHREYPQAQLEGVEHSPWLSVLGRWRLAFTQTPGLVSRGDLWRESWAGVQAVYCFQRPESMPGVWAKACREMAPGSWLFSLEFEVPGVRPAHTLSHPGQRVLRAYRVRPLRPAPGARPEMAGRNGPVGRAAVAANAQRRSAAADKADRAAVTAATPSEPEGHSVAVL